MKRLLFIILLISGCATLDPQLTYYNRANIVGEWDLTIAEHPRQKIILSRDALRLIFKPNGSMIILHEGKVFGDFDGDIKYAIENNKITFMAFNKGEHISTGKAKIKINGKFLYIFGFRAKMHDPYVNLKKFPVDEFAKITAKFTKTS